MCLFNYLSDFIYPGIGHPWYREKLLWSHIYIYNKQDIPNGLRMAFVIFICLRIKKSTLSLISSTSWFRRSSISPCNWSRYFSASTSSTESIGLFATCSVMAVKDLHTSRFLWIVSSPIISKTLSEKLFAEKFDYQIFRLWRYNFELTICAE